MFQRLIVLWILIQSFSIGSLFAYNLNEKPNSYKDTCKCNYNCWPLIKDSINGLTEQQILSFLQTLGKDCENNAEFFEFSSENLFKIIEFNSTIFIAAIEKHQADVELSEILKMIENPISDAYDLEKIFKLLNDIKSYSVAKVKIIESLKIAINKTK